MAISARLDALLLMEPDGASSAVLSSMHHTLKPRILCIDDEAPVGELLRILFEKTGDFHVAVETKSVAAVNRARQFRPDLVFMDSRMPGPDGFARARDFRREPGLCHRPIIF